MTTETVSGPLAHSDTREAWEVSELGAKVWAAPGYLIFMTAMHAGRQQEITVDPGEDFDRLIAALKAARKVANRKA